MSASPPCLPHPLRPTLSLVWQIDNVQWFEYNDLWMDVAHIREGGGGSEGVQLNGVDKLELRQEHVEAVGCT